MIIHCKRVSKGKATGPALITREPLSFLGGVDPSTGIIIEKGHPLENQSIAGKVLIFPNGKGSTVGAYVLYQLKKNGKAPAAIINIKTDPTVASGAIIAGIPTLHKPDEDPMNLPNGVKVFVNADEGYAEVIIVERQIRSRES